MVVRNNQSQKSGLNKSFCGAGVGKFLDILSYKAENAGKKVIRVNPNYTSQIQSRIHIKRVGLDVFPTIKRRKGKDKDIRIIPKTTSTLKEILELPRSTHHTEAGLMWVRHYSIMKDPVRGMKGEAHIIPKLA